MGRQPAGTDSPGPGCWPRRRGREKSPGRCRCRCRARDRAEPAEPHAVLLDHRTVVFVPVFAPDRWCEDICPIRHACVARRLWTVAANRPPRHARTQAQDIFLFARKARGISRIEQQRQEKLAMLPSRAQHPHGESKISLVPCSGILAPGRPAVPI